MTRASTLHAVPDPTLTGLDALLAMLAYRRPAWTKTEERFIERFIRPLGMAEDAIGNLYKRIGDAPILWSCHTDTVHTQGGIQTLRHANGVVTQSDPQSNCLGADCTAGAWLMIEMIRANRPGLYVFHRAEEIGGIGSSYIEKHNPALLKDLSYAVAFDRRGTKSIITHQWGGRCCSDTFALSLAKALGMGHKPDSGGSFTDTANYTDIIGECSNLSVGYSNEHTKRESLDVAYLQALRDALLILDVNALVYERLPGDVDEADIYDDVTLWPDVDQEPRGANGTTLASLVRDHPAEVADWLEEYGITADEIATAIYLRGGVLRNQRRY